MFKKLKSWINRENKKGTPLWKSLLFERRLPHRYKSLCNFKNEHLNFIFRKILKTPSFESNPESKVDYFTIVCHKHLNLYLLSVKSFLRFYNDIRVVIADDGSLTDKDCSLLKKHINGAIIFRRDYLNSEINRKFKNYDFLKQLRKNDVSQLKIIDANLLCNKRKMLVDTDVFFLKKPDEIIEWCKNEESKPFYHTTKLKKDKKSDLEMEFKDNLDEVNNVQYFFRKNLAKINKLLNTNIDSLDYCAGAIGYNKIFSMEEISKVQKELYSLVPKGFNPWGIEQCSYAFLLRDISNRLNDEHYFAVYKDPSKEEVKEAKMIHFVGKAKYRQFLKQGKKIIKELKDN